MTDNWNCFSILTSHCQKKSLKLTVTGFSVNFQKSFIFLFRLMFVCKFWNDTYHKDFKKQGDLRNSLVLLGATSLLYVAQ